MGGDKCARLVACVAHYLDEPPEAVDAETPFARYGPDSGYIFSLSGNVEDVRGVTVEPSVIWEVADLAELPDHVVEAAAGASPG